MKVKFLPSEEEHEIEFNETILHLAQRVGLHIQSVCKGIPSCAECRIQIKEGEHHVLPPNKKEIDLIGTAHYVDMSRLSCQLRCFGDVTVDLSEQIEKEKRVSDKPRDRMARSDGKESQAVLGGILDNVVAADVDVVNEEVVEVVTVESFVGDPNLDKKDSFYGDFYNEKKKNKGRGQQKQRSRGPRDGRHQQKAKSPQNHGGQSQEAGDKPKRKRNRRRRKPGGNKEGGSSNTSQGNS